MNSKLVAESYVGGKIFFETTAQVSGKVWRGLEALYNGEVSSRLR